MTAGEGLEELGAAGSHESVDGHDLSLVDGQGDVVHGDPRRVGGVGDHEVLDPEDGIADLGEDLREEVRLVPPGHGPDDPGKVDPTHRLGGDHAPVPQDDGGVGDLEALVHVMGDVDDGDAIDRQLADDAEEDLDLGGRQRGGGLVHDEDAGLLDQRPRDLDELLLPQPQVADEGVGIDGLLQTLQDRPGDVPLLPLGHAPCAGDLPAQEDVVDDGQVGAEVELLVDDGHAVGDGLGGGGEDDGLAAQLDGSRGGALNTGEDLHEGGLAGAVLADESDHLALMDLEVDAPQGVGRAEGLGDVTAGEHDGGVVAHGHDAASTDTGVMTMWDGSE